MEYKNISLADQVYGKLENDILTGKLARGEVFTEMKLCELLGVSRTPVREALSMLTHEHLVKETGKGIKILGITKDDLADIMEIRIRIEALAAEKCAKNINEEGLEKLKDAIELQEFYLKKNDAEKIKAMDSEFHALVYEYSQSTVLLDTLEPLHSKVRRYRKAAMESVERAEQSVSEHKKIFDAIKQHDSSLAGKLMKEHVKNAKKAILKG
ncbi:MAG: GntR family transcriptional regulator [Clostridia bacterium]|nr:GntR family transcriptional regulator [Clostridia bacterium]